MRVHQGSRAPCLRSPSRRLSRCLSWRSASSVNPRWIYDALARRAEVMICTVSPLSRCSSPSVKRKYTYPNPFWVHGKQRTSLQIHHHLLNGGHNQLANHIRTHILRADLYHARLFAVRRCQDGPEVKIMGEHNIAVRTREIHYVDVLCIGCADARPVHRFDISIASSFAQRGDKFMSINNFIWEPGRLLVLQLATQRTAVPAGCPRAPDRGNQRGPHQHYDQLRSVRQSCPLLPACRGYTLSHPLFADLG